MTSRETTTIRARKRATLVRFDEAQFDELKSEARLAGVSAAEFVRQAVAAWCARHARQRNAAARSNGANSANGGPP